MSKGKEQRRAALSWAEPAGRAQGCGQAEERVSVPAPGAGPPCAPQKPNAWSPAAAVIRGDTQRAQPPLPSAKARQVRDVEPLGIGIKFIPKFHEI